MGRLHMKWGGALGFVGRKDESRAQYHIASTLDLSVADKAEPARDMRGQSRAREAFTDLCLFSRIARWIKQNELTDFD